MIDKIFNPKTIAVIGATDRKNSVGRGVVENLKNGTRKVFYINPNKNKVFGKKTYKNINDIKEKIDFAIIVIPRKFVSMAVDDCITKKVKTVMIISSGFKETGKEGELLEGDIASRLKNAKINLIGPNTLGVIRPSKGLNASFAPSTPKKGEMAFIFQSGGLVDALVDGINNKSLGFSFIVSVGNEAGLTFSDYIKMADEDKHTNAIALYIEGIKNGREFYETVKNCRKPVVVIKAGKAEKAQKAIALHTGSLAGTYQIFSGAMKQAGAFKVNSLQELLNTTKALAWLTKANNKIGVVSNTGGAGVLLVDCLEKHNFKFPKISVKSKLLELSANPLDILGDALTDKYEEACTAALKDNNTSLLIVIQTPQIMTSPIENAKMIVRLKEKYKKPIITIFMGEGGETLSAINYLEKNKIPNYSDPYLAVKPLLAITN